MSPAPRDAGFTLVEALVSLLVFALLASGATMMLSQSVAAQARVGAAHEHLRELQTAQALFAADIAQAVVRPVRADPSQEEPLLEFVRASATPREGAPHARELIHVAYVVRGRTLVRITRTALDASAGAPTSERTVFADVSDARLEVYDGQSWRPAQGGFGMNGAAPSALALSGELARYGEIRIAAATGLAP